MAKRGNPALVKGKSGNPKGSNGRPAFDPAIRQFKETAYRDFIDALQRYGFMTHQELESELNRPDISNFDRLFGNIVMQASKGDKDARAMLIERLWGRVQGDPAMQINFTNLPMEKLSELAAKALRTLQVQRPELLDPALLRMTHAKATDHDPPT